MPNVAIPKEIKINEARVGGLPEHARKLRDFGVPVFVQSGAGTSAGFSDAEYAAAGATIVASAAELYERGEIIWKVKEILPDEFPLLHARHIIFGYLHPCPRPEMVQVLARSRCTAITFEDVMENGRRVLLTPMSQIAGAGAVLLAGQFVQTPHAGSGKLLFATDATEPIHFLVLGGGAAGRAAVRSALGAGATVTVLEANATFVPQLRTQFPGATVEPWSPETFERLLLRTDVLINCTMWMPGDPHLLTRPMLKRMRPGSLIMDVSADARGAIETSETTTHDDPLRTVDGILHYCVENIPALFARSASQALSAATYPYLERLAREGVAPTLRQSTALRNATVAHDGQLFGDDLARIQKITTRTHDDLLRLLPAAP